MDIEEEFDDVYEIVSLITDEGVTEDFYIIDAAKFDGYTYVLTVPVNEQDYEDEDSFEAVILREIPEQSDDINISYDIVTDEEEFEKVANFFSESGDFDVSIE